MMTTLAIIIFILGYAAITLEHPLRVNKTAPALLTAGLIWTVYMLMGPGGEDFQHGVIHHLREHLGETAEILFFLLGAMTIVEIIDAHQGFKIITNRIKTKNQKKLLLILCVVTFFMSATLDNLTTAIVMVSLLRRLIHDKTQRMFFLGMIVIAANAGGAWSPIGDVTTTMLWIKGQITDVNIIKTLIIPSLVCMIVPVGIAMLMLKGDVIRADYDYDEASKAERIKGSRLMFFLGVGGLLFVPVFKVYTHLPPYLGMLISLSIIWAVSELLHLDKEEEERKEYTAIHALTKVDVPSVLFFLGILLAIGGLGAMGLLNQFAAWMDQVLPDKGAVALAIGAGSAIIDNVPLVAAAQGMYSMVEVSSFGVLAMPSDFYFQGINPKIESIGGIMGRDGYFWEFLAYAAGTGGSMLIIGSAAGVAVMGMEKIDFFWYVKKISWLALIGYLAGAGTYMLVQPWFAH